MAFGIGKAIKKGWKKAFGWADDDLTKTIAGGLVVGALTGGIGGLGYGLATGATGSALAGTAGAGAALGAGLGGLQGGMTGYSAMQQEKALKAQIASSEKLAQMQQATVISAAPPAQTSDNAAITEANNAAKKARAFRLANSVRGNTLGGGSSSSNKKRTLG